MRTLKKSVVLSLSSLLVATAWSGCGTSNPAVEDTNSGGLTPGDGDAGSDASSGDGDEGPMFPGGDGDGDGLGPGGPGGPGDGDGDGDGDSDAAVIIPRDYPDATFSYTPPTEDAGSCADVAAGATLTKRPVDVIISIDNSGSMAGEIQAVIDRINGDFAEIIEDSGIDYRVIMVSRYGNINFTLGDTNYSVCIGPPLGNALCPTAPAPTLVNTERFFHHSTDIGSNNMWCRLLTSLVTTDEYPTSRGGWTPLAPNGWQDWLRPEALKVFVGITDDRPLTNSGGTSQRCTTASGLTDNQAGATSFDSALRAALPAQFGAYDALDPDANRNYIWHSIVGLTPKAGDAGLEAYQPAEAIITTICQGTDTGSSDDDGVAAGQGYQYLSQMTGGLRYSNCLNDNFDAIFNAIAEGVIEGAVVNCDFEIPDPGAGNEINFDNVTVTYLEGGASANMPDALSRVDDVNDCAGNDEYYLGVQGDAGGQDFNRVFLCPDTCTRVQADADAEISVGFGCLGQ